MKQKTGRKLLSFLLTLVMVLSQMPGMSLTAHAETYATNQNLSTLALNDILDTTVNSITLTNDKDKKAFYAIADEAPTRNEDYTSVEQNGSFPLPVGFKYKVIEVAEITTGATNNGWYYTFAEVKYPLWIGGTQVTSGNASNIDGNNKASYNDSTHTLTLNGYNLTVSNGDLAIEYGIKYTGSDPLTINLEGENAIEGYLNFNRYRGIDNGIYITRDPDDIAADVTFTGEGSLSIKTRKNGIAAFTNTNTDASVGNIVFSGSGEIEVVASQREAVYTNYGTVTVNSGTVTANGTKGIYTQKGVSITGGTVNAIGTGEDSNGIETFNELSITGGTVIASGEENGISAGWYGENDTITISEKVISVTISSSGKAISGKLLNKLSGKGWTNVAGTEGETTIEAVNEAQGVSETLKKIYFSSHEHNFAYTASGATITATCSEDDCPLTNKQATLTIAKPALTTYGGNESAEAQITDTDSIKGDSSIVYKKGDETLASAPTGAGTYTANITLGEGNNAATATVEYTIAKASETAPNSDTTQLNINYTAETISAKDGYEVAGDGSGTSISSFSNILDSDTPTVFIRKTATDNNHDPSAWVAVTLVSRPSAPTAPATENATNDSTVDGKIKGALATWEYKNKDTDKEPTNWTTMTDGDVTVKSGTYQIRVKATDLAPHGVETEVTVGSNYVALTEANKPTISVSGSHNPPVVGDTLTASTTATDIVYEWYRDGVKISSATAKTYILTADDVGKAITVKVKQTKQADGTDYTNGSEPTQTSDATAAVAKKSSPAAPANATTTGFTPNYPAETFTVSDNYEVSSTNGDTVTAISSLTDVIDGTGKIYIRVKETADTKAGAWLEVTLPSRPDAPTGLTSENATNGSTADGKIKGTSALMEYKLKGSTNGWTDATATETAVKSGTYLVRVKSTDSAPHGVETEVTVGSNYVALTEANKPTISVSDSHNPPVAGDTLTASTTATDIVYEWYRDGVKISSATAKTYILTADDVGKAITVKVKQTKQADGTDYTNGSEPTQTSDATAAVAKKSSPAAPANATTTGFTPNYPAETFTVGDGYEVSSTNGDTVTAISSLTDVIDGTGKIYIRVKETADTKAGAWLEVTLPSRPDAPTGLTSENATNGSTADGKIKGALATWEYKNKDTDKEPTNWTTMTDGDVTVKSGTYQIRVKATESAPHGVETEVTVGNKEIILSDEQKPTAKIGLTYNGTEQALINAPTAVLPEGAIEMRYAIGTNATTVPTSGWSTSIPTGTDAKTYYVWYKVVGDANHNATDPVCVTVTISNPSSGGSSTTTVTVPVTSDATPGTVPVKASVSGTTATVTKLTDEQITQVTTNKSGNKDADAETETNSVVIDVSGVAKDVKTAAIPTETVKAVEETGSNLKVTLTDGSVEFDATAQATITDEAKGATIQVNLDAVKVTTLTSAQQSAVESLEVEVVLDAYVTSNGQRISDFKGGSATLSVPYTLKDGQAAQGIVVWYVASNGTRTQVDASYDGKNVVFSVPHFSNYVIAYDAEKAAACPQDTTCPISAFTDAKASAWYHDGVHWALENGVMNGMGNGKFAPNDTTTRAQVVTMLWRLEGSPAYVGMSEFSDVDNEEWYGPAIRWASAEGIVNGYDDGKFGPNDAVSREQLVTILYRYAQYKKLDVSVGEDTNILSYDDAFDVSEWAIPAMQWACDSGVVNGIDKNGTLMLAPSDASTRAVVATMFWRFSK